MVKESASNAEDAGSGLGLGTKISHAPGGDSWTLTCWNLRATVRKPLHNSTNIPHEAVKILLSQLDPVQSNKQTKNKSSLSSRRLHIILFTAYVTFQCNCFWPADEALTVCLGNPGSIHIKALHFWRVVLLFFHLERKDNEWEDFMC